MTAAVLDRPTSATSRTESEPLYDQAVQATGIDPVALSNEIRGLIVNARSALARIYREGAL